MSHLFLVCCSGRFSMVFFAFIHIVIQVLHIIKVASKVNLLKQLLACNANNNFSWFEALVLPIKDKSFIDQHDRELEKGTYLKHEK